MLELQDNSTNGIDLNLILLNDPSAEKFDIEHDEQGNRTHWGTVTRNLAQEARDARGLAPPRCGRGMGFPARCCNSWMCFLRFVRGRPFRLNPDLCLGMDF